MRVHLALLAALSSIPLVLVSACGSSSLRAHTSDDASVPRIPATPKPGPAPTATASAPLPDASLPPPSDASACGIDEEQPSILPAVHVPVGTPLAYDSNPPSSGPHYPIWADYEEYTSPVPDGYLVHALEHGGVLLLYKCEALDAGAGTCPELVAALRSVRDALPDDPSCTPPLRVRVILAPRPANDAPVAAAAWGYTYRSDCIDLASLGAFVRDHYAKAPENTCAPGINSF